MPRELDDCLDGRPEAWESFVRRYAPVIYTAIQRTAAHRVRGDIDQFCQDAAQDVFLRLIRDDFALLRTYDPARATLSTWLTIVARSAAIDALRKRSIATVPLDQAAESGTSDVPASPESETPVRHLPTGLLSPRQALVLQLLFDRQMEVAEVASLLGIDEQTVRSTRGRSLIFSSSGGDVLPLPFVQQSEDDYGSSGTQFRPAATVEPVHT
jgi:RNA polymerase sigma-70 factor (ECF subfamily)